VLLHYPSMTSRAPLLLASMLLAVSLFAGDAPVSVAPETQLDPGLQAKLLAILESDQAPRLQLETAAREKGYNSPEVAALQDTMLENDDANIATVSALLDQRGWITPEVGGPQASHTLFMVIQHAALPWQQKYLPLVREAVKAGWLKPGNLALLEDRVALREGRPQTYGSQLRTDSSGKLYVQPLIDPEHVDERRAAIGLPPMADYVKHWNLTWDVEAYKRDLAQMAPPQPEVPMPSRKYSNKALRGEMRGIQREVLQRMMRLSEIQQKSGAQSDEAKSFQNEMAAANVGSLAAIETIIAQYGWVAPDVVGRDVYDTQFLIIQQADPAVRKKYLPILHEAVTAGKARPDELARLEDQVAVDEGRPQLYGTQVELGVDGKSRVYLLSDPDHVDERRAAVGLPPMADYVKDWGLTWDLAAYKQSNPAVK
jgi:hypothetical protein